MHRYDIPMKSPAVYAEAKCSSNTCGHWNVLTVAALRKLNRDWKTVTDNPAAFVEMWGITCEKCSKRFGVCLVGKYDKIDVPRSQCSMLYVRTKPETKHRKPKA